MNYLVLETAINAKNNVSLDILKSSPTEKNQTLQIVPPFRPATLSRDLEVEKPEIRN